MRRLTLILLIGALGIAGAACGGAEPTPAVAPADPQAIEIVAENIALLPGTISVPSGTELHIRFDNRDSGIPHNNALMADAQFSTTLAETEIVIGPATQDLVVPGLIPGAYRFTCVVHPNMITDLTVEAGSAS